MYKCNKVKSEAIIIHPKVNGISTPMEVDTGASLSVINKDVFNKLTRGDVKLILEDTNVKVKTYSGQSISALGKVKIPVHYRDQNEVLDLYVIEGNNSSLLGRDL